MMVLCRSLVDMHSDSKATINTESGVEKDQECIRDKLIMKAKPDFVSLSKMEELLRLTRKEWEFSKRSEAGEGGGEK